MGRKIKILERTHQMVVVILSRQLYNSIAETPSSSHFYVCLGNRKCVRSFIFYCKANYNFIWIILCNLSLKRIALTNEY